MRPAYGLVGLWLLLAALVAGLTIINPNHFVSVDSQYYLSKAGWLVGLDGDQYGHKAVGWEGDFPIGYPLLIGVLARLTGLSLLVSSKLVNLLFVGLFLVIWRRRVGAVSAAWMGSVLLLGGYVRIITYTWSECVFLVLLLEWFWIVRAIRAQPPDQNGQYRPAIRLLLLTIALFSLRYAGSFFVVAYGLMTGVTYGRGGWSVVRRRIGPDLVYGLLAGVFILGTFYLNSRLSPWPLGTERFYEADETVWDKLYLIALAPVNELLLLRDYIIGEPSALFWLGLGLQLVLFGWLWRILQTNRELIVLPSALDKQLFTTWLWASATYLVILCIMRLFSPFSGPNARMMSVVSLPLLMGVACWVSRWPALIRHRLARWWAVLLLCSWLQLLPQADFWGKLTQFFARL